MITEPSPGHSNKIHINFNIAKYFYFKVDHSEPSPNFFMLFYANYLFIQKLFVNLQPEITLRL